MNKEIQNINLYVVKAINAVKVDGINISKSKGYPEKELEFPLITYELIDEELEYTFNYKISKQIGLFDIRIYAKTAKELSKIKNAFLNTMLINGVSFKGGYEKKINDLKVYITQCEIRI